MIDVEAKLEELREAKEKWILLKEQTAVFSEERERISKKNNGFKEALHTQKLLLDKLLIAHSSDSPEIHDVLDNIRQLQVDIEATYKQHKIANKKYNEAWPKHVKVEKKCETLQKDFWKEVGLHVGPSWN